LHRLLVPFANLFTQIVWHRALLYLSGGSATELSATDAWAEPLPVIEVNVWTSLYVAWARNPMCGPGRRGLGGLSIGRGHWRGQL